jgi:hypothetical protein
MAPVHDVAVLEKRTRWVTTEVERMTMNTRMVMLCIAAVFLPGISGAQSACRLVFENRNALVYHVPKEDQTKTQKGAKAVGNFVINSVREKGLITIAAKVVPAAATTVGGLVLGIIGNASGVGCPSMTKVTMLSNRGAGASVDINRRCRAMVTYRYSDTFNTGVKIRLEKRHWTFKWEKVSEIQLLTLKEVMALDKVAHLGDTFVVVSKHPWALGDGKFRVFAEARSFDGRAAKKIQVVKPRTR